jgi:thiol-disulfide isomerase/thioredoxin
MGAITIGPLMFAPDRFAAVLAAAVFVVVGEFMSRRIDPRYGPWSWWALGAFALGARLGHVIQHGASFADEPWRVFALWQGGFFWPAGVFAVVVVTITYLRKLKAIAWAALPAGLCGVAAVIALHQLGDVPALPLPEGTYMSLDGRPVATEALKGKPVVMNLWATWCPPCRRELPMMAEIAGETTGVTFVFVNQAETSAQVSTFLTEEKLPLTTVLLDPRSAIARHYQTPGLPATLFIGADGGLRSVTLGEISRENLSAGIEALEAEQAGLAH